MKVFIKPSKGPHFQIDVSPDDTVADVKKNIEDLKGYRVYPAFGQMLIYQGKALKDDTTLKENKIVDDSFLLIKLTKSKNLVGEGSGSSNSRKVSSKTSPPTATTAAPRGSVPVTTLKPAPVATPSKGLDPISMVNSVPVAGVASNKVAISNIEDTVQQIIDMGGGAWNRDIVIQALGAAFNNPEQAIEYLYSGIPNPNLIGQYAGNDEKLFQPAALPDPLNSFPQGLPNVDSNVSDSGTSNLGFLRESHQFQALRAVVQANPETLQQMLVELGKRNPNLMKLIEEHYDEFLCLVHEPVDSVEGNAMELLASMTPLAIQVTPKERDAIVRLETMGFDQAIVLEVFFACNKNEALAANYLLDHMDEF